MSTNLYWEPVEIEKKRSVNAGDDGLKLALREEYGYPLNEVFTKDDLPLFKGLAMGGVKGTKKIIELLEKYDEVRLYEAE